MSNDRIDDNSRQPQHMAVITERGLIDIFKYLMRQYVADKGLDTESMRQTHVEQLVNYCLETEQPIRDAEELAVALEVPKAAVEYVWQILHNPYQVCQLVFPFWRSLILSGKAPPKNKMACFVISLAATFQDNTIIQLQTMCPWPKEKVLTDGFFCDLVMAQFGSILNAVVVKGLDKLHDEIGQNIDERLAGTTRKLDLSQGSPLQGPQG
jgi:hypothetical protein